MNNNITTNREYQGYLAMTNFQLKYIFVGQVFHFIAIGVEKKVGQV